MLDLVIFATLAIFVIYKLRRILGEEYEVEQKSTSSIKDVNGIATDPKTNRSQQNMLKNLVSGIKKEKIEDTTEDARKQIIQKQPDIKEVDLNILVELYKIPGFSFDGFINGATHVFEKIMDNYSNNNIENIIPFASEKVINDFKKVIDSNIEKQVFEKVVIAKIDEVKLLYCEKTPESIYIAVEFKTEQITYSENMQNGSLVNGSKSIRQPSTEVWTFAKFANSPVLDWLVCSVQISSPIM